ncbi:MAG: VWA domain-containing protein [Streptosporangiales bacterium]|nr:VWA domain-containing protein [Streptosporangiales bacterium]MBO0890229.1 VWA domain-containing protein [Acidothermales bacterium]
MPEYRDETSAIAPAGRKGGRRLLVSTVAFAVAGALLLGACGKAGSGAQDSPSPSPSQTFSTSSAGRDDGLDAYFVDSDGDGIPDKIQQAIGETNGVDSCASKVCAGAAKDHNASMARIIRGTSTMVILDSSGSMQAKTHDGQTRMSAAKKAIRDYVDNSPSSTEQLGLMVYGQAGSNRRSDRAVSCRQIKTVKPIGQLNKANVAGALAPYSPHGWTPLAASLKDAAKQFADAGTVNRVVVVTDGIEECGGNPKAEARMLRRSGLNVRIDVVGLGAPKGHGSAQLASVAKVAGGTFTAVNDTAGLERYFDDLLGQWVATANLSSCVADHFVDYSSCQAVRWQKARKAMRSEVDKLRSQGDGTAADQLQTRINDTSTYYLTTLATHGLSEAKKFTPSSAEVKQIKAYLADSGSHGRAVLHAADYRCHA